MPLPSFIDKANTSATINVENKYSRGAISLNSTQTGITISLSVEAIEPPPANSIVLAQASMVVQTDTFVRYSGSKYSGGSASAEVTDMYYNDQVVELFVNIPRDPIISQAQALVPDKVMRVFWS
jgi:hypothetical protein